MVAVLRLHRGDIIATDEDATLVDLFQAGQHAQSRGLTAARRADQHQELAVLNVKIQIIHRGLIVARVDTSDVVEYDFCHDIILSEAGTCLTHRVTDYCALIISPYTGNIKPQRSFFLRFIEDSLR